MELNIKSIIIVEEINKIIIFWNQNCFYNHCCKERGKREWQTIEDFILFSLFSLSHTHHTHTHTHARTHAHTLSLSQSQRDQSLKTSGWLNPRWKLNTHKKGIQWKWWRRNRIAKTLRNRFPGSNPTKHIFL